MAGGWSTRGMVTEWSEVRITAGSSANEKEASAVNVKPQGKIRVSRFISAQLPRRSDLTFGRAKRKPVPRPMLRRQSAQPVNSTGSHMGKNPIFYSIHLMHRCCRAGTIWVGMYCTTSADVFDRVLDKGIVIDGYHHYSVGGVYLGDIKSHMVVASLSTYLDRVEFLADAELLSPSWLRGPMGSQTRRVRIIRPKRVRIIRRVIRRP